MQINIENYIYIRKMKGKSQKTKTIEKYCDYGKFVNTNYYNEHILTRNILVVRLNC